MESQNLTDRQKVVIAKELSIASGIRGMVSGQGLDMKISNNTTKSENITQNYLMHVHRLKTGKLFEFSASIISKIMDMPHSSVAQFEYFGINYGFIFQIVDDIEDYKDGKKEKQSFMNYSDSIEDLLEHINLLKNDIVSIIENNYGDNNLSKLLDITIDRAS